MFLAPIVRIGHDIMSFPHIREFRLGGPIGDGVHPYLNERGAFLGDGTPLLEKDSIGCWRARARPNLEKSVSRSYGVPANLEWRMGRFEAVARALNKGNRSLAAIILVHAELPPLPQRIGAHRAATLGSRFSKDGYDVSNEPRIPAGQAGGGEWTDGGGEGVSAGTNGTTANSGDGKRGRTIAPVATTVAVGAEASAFLSGLGRAALVALTELGATLVGPITLAAGLILIPTSMGGVSEGTLPDRDDIKYRYDEGSLSIWRTSADGTGDLIFSGPADQDGLYRDTNGDVLGRDLGGSIAINAPGMVAMADAREAERSRDDTQTTSVATTDRPQVCPDPSPDVPHGASPRAIEYQSQVSGLPPGLAVWLNGVSFDGCRTTDGVMLEAKGPGYVWALGPDGWRPGYSGGPNAEAQMIQQSEAAANRLVEWHIAEPSVAEYFRQFAQSKGLTNVVVIYTPARAQ